jgi:hypothetical protein
MMPHVEHIGSDGSTWPSVTQVLHVVDQPWKWAWYKHEVKNHGFRGWLKCIAKGNTGMSIGTDFHNSLYDRLVDHYKLEKEKPEWEYASSNRHHPLVEKMAEQVFGQVQLMNPKIVDLETHLIHDPLRYHGTTDAIVFIDGQLELWDWKSNSTKSDDHPVQLGAYAAAWNLTHLATEQINFGRIIGITKELEFFNYPFDDLNKYFGEFTNRRGSWDYAHHQGQWFKEKKRAKEKVSKRKSVVADAVN